jgi:hypothetical protein
MTTQSVTCPDCKASRDIDVDAERHLASEFCTTKLANGSTCDYPLFWAPSKTTRAFSTAYDGNRDRRPGLDGLDHDGQHCPSCRELNSLLAFRCLRCGASLEQAPPPPPPPLAPFYDASTEPAEPTSRWKWWYWALIGAAVVAATIIIIVVIVNS